MFHDWTDLKSIFLDFVCSKGLTFTNKKSMASSTFWWCLAMRGGTGIIGMVLWCSGIIMIYLPCMMGIWGPIYGFCYYDVVCGNWSVPDLILLDDFF